jgi:hypothetical protein
MKRFNIFLSLVLLWAAGMTASAQSQYYEVETDPVTEIDPDQTYALAGAAYISSGTYYLSGTTYTTSATESIVYQFEPVGATSDGSTTYMLKQVSTGLYLESPTFSTSETPTLQYTDSKTRAFVFTAKQSVAYDSYDDEVLETADFASYTYANDTYPEHPGSFVLCDINYEPNEWPWLMFNNTGPAWDPQYVNTNIWYVYRVNAASAYDNLCLYVENKFGELTPSDLFRVGSEVGQVSEELFQTFQTAYNNAQKLISDSGQNDDVYTTAQLQLEEAYSACDKGAVPVKEGYVVIRNYMSDRANGNGCIYDGGSNANWDEFIYDGGDIALKDAHHIWQIIKSENDGYYYLRNFSTGRYMGTQATIRTSIPTTEEPSQTYLLTRKRQDAFAIYNPDMNASYPALHGQIDLYRLVIWGANASGSWWNLVYVPESTIDALAEEVTQNRLKEQAQSLINAAHESLAKGIKVTSAATEDGLYDDLGFVTNAGQFFSNAQEPTEGTFAALIDNSQTTYFHSVWSDATYADRVHYLGVDLGKAVQYLNVKYSRRNDGNNGTPKSVHVYATNDTTGLAAGTCTWSDQAYLTFSYPYASNDTYSSTVANFTGLSTVVLDAPYRYLRFDVEHTLSDGTTNGNLYFHLSEFHLYEGTYLPEDSPIAAVPEDIITTLRESLAQVQGELADESITQTSLDALSQAIATFNANYPDPSELRSMIAEAEEQLEAAEEGSAVGYYADGSKNAYQEVITSVSDQLKDVMSLSEISTLKAALAAATAAFEEALNKPEEGAVIRIRCATTSTASGSAANSFLYATGNDKGIVSWGGYDATNGEDEYLTERLNYYWRLIHHGNGAYSFQNLGTGLYIGNPKQNNVKVYTSLEADTIGLRSAKVPGLFNVVLTDGVYLNAQPGTNNMVTWNSASGTDNSAFELEIVDENIWTGSYHYGLSDRLQVVTLPLEISGLTSAGTLYKVIGIKDNAIQLDSYSDDDVIAAGTPFIYQPNDDAEDSSTDFYPTAATLSEITTVTTAGSQGGLQGTLQSATPGAGYGILYNNGTIFISTANDVVSANSGWFTDAIEATAEEGTLQIPVDGQLSAIHPEVISDNTPTDVYTLTGVRIRTAVDGAATATRNLPQGLYIIGKKKVWVK